MTPGASENGNENAVELLTIAEAGDRLKVTIPRLRRLLSRPEFAAHIQTVERGTRTGTRAAQVVPVSVLVLLQDALASGLQSQNEPKQEQEREQVKTGTGTETNENAAPEATPPDAGPLVEQLQSENAFLRAEVERHHQAESELRRLMLADKQELSELRQRLAIEARAAPPRDAVDAPRASDGKEEAAAGKAEQEGSRREWWQFWK